MVFKLTKRAFPVRFWRSYCAWRRILPVLPAIHAAWLVAK